VLPAHWPAAQQKPAPHVPSPGLPQALSHEPPLHVGVCPPHAWHALPLSPHLSFCAPGAQLVPSQQPPLHVRPPVHEVEHTCVDPHASPCGQSFAGSLHPQAPATQAVPCAELVQSTHWPGGPQLVVVLPHGGGGATSGVLVSGGASNDVASTPPPVSFADESTTGASGPLPVSFVPVASAPDEPPASCDPLAPSPPLLLAASMLASVPSASRPDVASPQPARIRAEMVARWRARFGNGRPLPSYDGNGLRGTCPRSGQARLAPAVYCVTVKSIDAAAV
jgi:hypothetical protein